MAVGALAGLMFGVNPDKSTFARLRAYKNQNGQSISGGIDVTCDSDGNFSAVAPKTANDANGNEIAVASFTKEYGGLNYGVGGGLNTSPSGSTNECFGSSDLNDWIKSGFYSVSVNNGKNLPNGGTSWTGILLALMRRWETGTSGLQICPDGNSFIYRTKSGSTWNSWFKLANDKDVVHLSGNEVIAGKKEFSDNVQLSGYAVRQIFKNIGINKGEIPSESQEILLRLVGGDGSTVANTFSELELCAHNSGDTYVRLWASKNVDGSSDRDYLEIRYDKSQDRFTTRAPTPITDSNDNSIATTGWVQALLKALDIEHHFHDYTTTSEKTFTATRDAICVTRVTAAGDGTASISVTVNGQVVCQTSGYHGRENQDTTYAVKAGDSVVISCVSTDVVTSISEIY